MKKVFQVFKKKSTNDPMFPIFININSEHEQCPWYSVLVSITFFYSLTYYVTKDYKRQVLVASSEVVVCKQHKLYTSDVEPENSIFQSKWKYFVVPNLTVANVLLFLTY